jgi:hypothetical protein
MHVRDTAVVMGFAALALAVTAAPQAGTRTLQIDGGTVEVAITGQPSVPEDALLQWIESCARAVRAYFGRYPVPHVRLTLRTGGPGGMRGGVTYGGRSPSITIAVGRETDPRDLDRDWRLTHEMVHLAFPNLTTDDTWAEEGLATYVEPLARARLGTLSEDKVWWDLIEGLPKGLPGPGDRGLHATEEWGRRYWGGALFWLLADIEIHERTGHRRGLSDALAGILEAGGDIRARWDLPRTLAVGDRAVGVSVLSELYREYAAAPGTVDLERLWARLGVRRVHNQLVYDDSAPQARIRRAIVGKPRDERTGDLDLR